jgi:siroheme synthase-like protein
VVLDVAGRPCLVVGGGTVAKRKVEGLVACGADVTVVAPEIDPAIHSLAATVEARPYREGEAAGYRLVITATGLPTVDAAVAADADAAGVWVNSADDTPHCTFLLPAVHRDGVVTVSVSTGGASPALSTWLRGEIATLLGPGLATLADLVAGARRRLTDANRPTTAVDWHGLLDGPLPGLVRDGKLDEARRLLDDAVDRAIGEAATRPVRDAPP